MKNDVRTKHGATMGGVFDLDVSVMPDSPQSQSHATDDVRFSIIPIFVFDSLLEYFLVNLVEMQSCVSLA